MGQKTEVHGSVTELDKGLVGGGRNGRGRRGASG